VWKRGLQARIATLIGRSSRYLPCVIAEEVLEGNMEVVIPDVTPLEADMTYPEHPIKILYQKNHVMRRKTIKLFKVQWSNHTKKESEYFLCSHHPDFELL
jgi:hypothetical protein